MTVQGLINAALSSGLTFLIIYLLACYGSVFNHVERLGYGMLGPSCFLSVFKQLNLEHVVAPFSPWYQTLWRVGLFLTVGGLAYRLRKHHLGNVKQSRILLAHLASVHDADRHP